MEKNKENNKSITSIAAMNNAVKGICNIHRRDRAKGARLYVSELTWLFFLRYMDLKDQQGELAASALGISYDNLLPSPYRWSDWAAPYSRSKSKEVIIENKEQGWKRCELDNRDRK